MPERVEGHIAHQLVAHFDGPVVHEPLVGLQDRPQVVADDDLVEQFALCDDADDRDEGRRGDQGVVTEFTRFRLVPVDGVGVLDGERVPADVFAADLEVVVHRVVVADEFGGPRRELIGRELLTALERQCTLLQLFGRHLAHSVVSFIGRATTTPKGHLFRGSPRFCAMGSRFGG